MGELQIWQKELLLSIIAKTRWELKAQLNSPRFLLIDEEIKNNPTFQKNEEFGLPELYSMQFNKKIFNTRLTNYQDNLGNLVKGITKDINEVSALIIDTQKYGT